YLTHGTSVADARQHLAAFLDHEQRFAPDAAASSLGLLLPTESDWRALPERLQTLDDFAEDFSVALERHGFSASAFDTFLDEWRQTRAHPPEADYEHLAASVQAMLTGPLALLSATHGPFWFLSLVEP